VGAAGSTYASFRRAVDRGNLAIALAEARDLPHVNLADALALLLLIRDQTPERYERAAARWLGRYCLETRGVGLREGLLVLGALTTLESREPRPGALALLALARYRRLRQVEDVVRRWLAAGGG
jgi:hypothetical protein